MAFLETLETSMNQYLSVNGEIMSENMAGYGYAFFKSFRDIEFISVYPK